MDLTANFALHIQYARHHGEVFLREIYRPSDQPLKPSFCLSSSSVRKFPFALFFRACAKALFSPAVGVYSSITLARKSFSYSFLGRTTSSAPRVIFLDMVMGDMLLLYCCNAPRSKGGVYVLLSSVIKVYGYGFLSSGSWDSRLTSCHSRASYSGK